MAKKFIQYSDQIARIYPRVPGQALTRDITFQVTDACNAACTYCYQTHKGNKKMNKDTAKKGIDLLFKMWDDNQGTFINQNTKAIVLEFIGGEPLLNIELIDFICSYFMDECLRRHHPWTNTWRGFMISNGSLYFTKEVQDFLKKFENFVSYNVSIDGPKEMHDACRIYPNGEGNFDDAYNALMHYHKTYDNVTKNTKVTISPENLNQLNTIVNFFIENNIKTIMGNPINETDWTLEQAQIYYQQLTQLADYLLQLNDPEIEVNFFKEDVGQPMPETEIKNWCGGNMEMLAFDVDGIAYPCIRYMESSLNGDVPPIKVGSVEGLFITEEEKNNQKCLSCITRRSQSTDECFYCPVARGCSWCSAWNYQCHKTLDKRSTSLCLMHKARVAANYYYWNKYYKLNNIDKFFKLYLSKKDYETITQLEYPNEG